MTNYTVRRQHGNLTSSPVQLLKRGDDDSNSTVDNSDDVENNPASEIYTEAVASELVDEKAIGFTTGSGADAVMFSFDEVRMMVLQSIPEQVRETKSLAAWDRLFHDAAEIVLPEDASHIGTNATAEDIKDIISFISASLQREAREHHIVDQAKSKPSMPKGTSLRYVDAVSLAIAAKDDVEDFDPDDDSYCEFVGSKKGQEVPSALRVADFQSSLRDMVKAASQLQILHALAPNEQTFPIKISFTDIEIRYYEQILSDNPSVRSGPPIGIGWRYKVLHKSFAVDTWEERRQNDRRYLAGLMISRHERTSRLLDLGYSRKDLATSIREVMRIKNSRKKTFQNMGFESMEEVLERICKTFKNVLTLGMIKRKERQLLKPYLELKENRKC